LRTAVSSLALVRPKNLADALRAMADTNGAARPVPLAGGTDLYVTLNAGAPAGTRFLDLWGLRELRGIRVGRNSVTLGALATFRDIRDHAVIRRRLPSLVAAAAEVGAWQIQNRATIAGNIANASPAGDSLPVLLAHDAIIRVRSLRGDRAIAFADLYTGYRALAMAPDELITAVEIPLPAAGTHMAFRKVGTRRAQSISKVVFCGVLRAARGGRPAEVRLAYGSVAPVTLRARGAETALVNAAPSLAVRESARDALGRDIAPIDDIRSTRDYRLAVAGNLLDRFLDGVSPAYGRG
jgi:CO/xanthine dehydrogenase FAD-binding subunit